MRYSHAAPLPSAILFDLDGTLSQTEQFWQQAEIAVSARHGGTWAIEDTLANLGHLVSDVAKNVAANIHEAGGDDVDASTVAEEILETVIASIEAADDVLTPGAARWVGLLNQVEIPKAVVTASPMSLVTPVLSHFPPDSFTLVVSADDNLPAKPNPEPYLVAARRLGVDIADCLIFEDSPTGVQAATASGAKVVVMRSMATLPDIPGRMRLQNFTGFTLDDLADLFGRASGDVVPHPLSGVRTGLLEPGERVTLTGPKGHRHSLKLESGKRFHTTKGAVNHDDIIGGREGVVVRSQLGTEFLVMRPLMNEFTVTMPREAAVIYPKDAAQILMWTDIFPGARVLEAGVGSGALSIALLRAIGPEGRLHSYERRPEFAEVAEKNVVSFLGERPEGWEVTVADLVEGIADEFVDRAVLDMLAPWECVDTIADHLVAGGVLTCYVATTTQMGRVMDTLRAHGGFTEPQATETTVRDWHAEGLAIRPAHSTTGHTGFLVIARRLAPGVVAPLRKRRPAPGAYGPDYTGPRPRNIPEEYQH